jgi:hypothetical protein
LRSPLLLFAVLTAFALSLLANVQTMEDGLFLRVLLDFAVLFVALGILARRYRLFGESAGAWSFFGWLGFLLCLYLLTFAGIVDDLLGWRHETSVNETRSGSQPVQLVYGWGPFALALLAWGAVAWPHRPGTPRATRPQDASFEHCLIPLTAIVCQVFTVTQMADEKWLVAGIFNLVFLALAATWMARGCREGLLRPTILGSLLLVALTVARYFDWLESLAVRGFLFLLVGGLLFVEGILFRRARRLAQTPEVPA